MLTQMCSSCFTKEKRERLVRIINIFACGLIVIQFCLWSDCHPVLFACGLMVIQFCLWFNCHPVLFACGLIVTQFCLLVFWLSSSSVCLWFDCHPILFVVWLSSNSVCLWFDRHPVVFACGLIAIQFCLWFDCHPILFACGLIVIQFCLPVVHLWSNSVYGLIVIQFCLWFDCHTILFACILTVIQFCLPVVWWPSNSVFRLPAVRQVLWHHGEEVWSTGKGNHRLWWLHSVLCCTSGRHFSSVIFLPEHSVTKPCTGRERINVKLLFSFFWTCMIIARSCTHVNRLFQMFCTPIAFFNPGGRLGMSDV